MQPGLYYCNGKRVQIEFDPNNCGLCGITCATDQVCQQFSCITAIAATVCPAGLNFCSGACVDLMNDSSNCGVCGTSCGGPQCIQGFCGGADTSFDECAARGYTNCNGVCVLLDSDSFNCGACGVACPAGVACIDGACPASGDTQLAAPADGCAAQYLVRCGDLCVDTSADVFNCGGCGQVCGVFDMCVAGACVAPDDQAQPSADDVPRDDAQPEVPASDAATGAPVAETPTCGPGPTDCSGS